ncbi:MAG: hypothetical protein R3362_10755, partial [Rhodothermales bacterium]|nr:hypothetical protein [Rhodothermales bacterium]
STASRSPARRSAAKKKAAKRPAAKWTGLPAWSDLSGKGSAAPKAKKQAERPGLVDAVPTGRFAALLVIGCALFTLYVGHVYATQQLASEVQHLQRENLRLVLKHNRLRGEFDRMTSPPVVLRRADELGLRASTDYEPTIVVPREDDSSLFGFLP